MRKIVLDGFLVEIVTNANLTFNRCCNIIYIKQSHFVLISFDTINLINFKFKIADKIVFMIIVKNGGFQVRCILDALFRARITIIRKNVH